MKRGALVHLTRCPEPDGARAALTSGVAQSQQVARPADRPLDEAVPRRAAAPFLEVDLFRVHHVVLEKVLHLPAERLVADDGGELEVVLDAAVIEVGRAE